MGRGRGKGKKLTEEEKIPPQKRPQKSHIDEETVEMIEEDDSELGIQNLEINGKKRRRNARVTEKHDSVKEENATDESNNVFRHRRKNKPRRAAEAGVKCN